MFHKMKVTGPKCAEFATEPLQAMRQLNPTLDAMMDSSEQMNKVICEAASKTPKKRRKMASTAVALHDLHLQRLKALKSDTGHTYEPLFQALVQPPPQPSAQQGKEDESSSGPQAAIKRVIDAVPKRFRNRVATLGDYLKSFPNLIRVSPTGRAIVNGVELQHTNIMDIMRSLYVWPKTQTHPRGTLEVVQALHSIGVPAFLLSNSAVRAMYHDLVEASEETHTETEESEETETEGQEVEEYGKQVEEHEGETFETPMHATGPPIQPLALKVEGHVSSKASPTMIPRLQRSSSIPSSTKKDEPPKPSTTTTAVASKTSGVATTSGQSKARTSQTSAKTEHTKPGTTVHTASTRGQMGKGRRGSDECASDDDDDDSCLPGKRSRILRLPQLGKFVLLHERPHAGGGVEQVYTDPHHPGGTIRILRVKLVH
jgi:hypothetical protein